MAQWLPNLTSIHKDARSIPALAYGLKIWCCCELWGRPAATALIGPLPWEPPHAAGVALQRQKDKKIKNKNKINKKTL